MRLLATSFTLALLLGACFPARGREEDATDSPQRGEPEPVRRVSVTANPVALLVQRYGGNLELVPARHHAFVLSAYAQRYSLDMIMRWLPSGVHRYVSREESYSFGGEIGYRLYSGRGGAEGVFIGPSFVFMPLPYPRFANGTQQVEVIPFHAPGVAFDVGAQTVTGIGLTVGGGVGVQYLAYELPADDRRVPLELAPRVLPRLLMTAGWSF